MDEGTNGAAKRLREILNERQQSLLQEWLSELAAQPGGRAAANTELRDKCAEFIGLLKEGAAAGDLRDPRTPVWQRVQEFLTNLSRVRSQQGFAPSSTAMFVLSLKTIVLGHLLESAQGKADDARDALSVSRFFDQLSLITTEAFQKAREEVISRQQQEMLELSTPVVKLWHGVLALPLIGTLDSERTQIVMEQLLQKIVETGSDVAIIDITGVPTVDTLVAQHLLKTVTAARLMGADCIISGIRPQIAQTIVHLGVALGDVTTKASLADAFAIALSRRNYAIHRKGASGNSLAGATLS